MIRKRDGRVVPFDIGKIEQAIFKASQAVGEANRPLAQDLAKKVLSRLEKKTSKQEIPTVEGIQDIVEQILIETGHAKIAKAYILYRQHRAEIRAEKQQILNKKEIDEIDKHFDINALRVLAARYLRKDDQGKIIESPKELFERVAVHVALPSLFYDSKIYQKRGGAPLHLIEKFDHRKFENKFSIGKFKLNQFHLEALKSLYSRFVNNRQIKVSWSAFLNLFKKGYFDKYEAEIVEYYKLMISRQFLPNTPALVNFGNVLGMGSACFTLDIKDSIESIMDTLKAAAIIFKAGGGVGYNFSKVRPEGDYVKSTGGSASGPISFMSMFDVMTDVIKQGGVRRGANMGILDSDHPDIEKFIKAKEGNKTLRNFNISVMLMPEFWDCCKQNKPYSLINPRTGKPIQEIDPRKLLDMLVYQAWESAEPGVLFFDRINEFNPFYKSLGPIYSTNPCSEVLLYPNESCNLASINVWNFVKKNNSQRIQFNWGELEKVVKIATRFLDNVIDVNKYPLKQIEEMTLNTRKIGLGIMGLGDLLYEFKIPYNSKEGLKFMERLIEFISYYSKITSMELSKERGRMPYFDKSFYKEGKLPFSGFKDKKSWHFDWLKLAKDIKRYGIRNSYTTVIAPTGSISMIAGCSSGIEPVYSLVFEKNVVIGNFYYIDPVFDEQMHEEGLMDEALIKDVAALSGSVQKLSYIPEKLKKIFVTALDITPKEHIRALAAFQKWVDSSISKTNNFPAEAVVDDIKEAYLLAYELGCKGVTVYRDTALKKQVLVGGGAKKKQEDKGKLVTIKDEKVKGLTVYHEAGVGEGKSLGLSPAPESLGIEDGIKNCPVCNTKLVRQEGCNKCPTCGWGLCL